MADKPSELIFDGIPVLIELLGHNRTAGKLTEVHLGNQTLLRVDVPAVGNKFAFTKFYGVGAVYAITVVDESTMELARVNMDLKPVEPYAFSLSVQSRFEPTDDDFEDVEEDSFEDAFDDGDDQDD